MHLLAGFAGFGKPGTDHNRVRNAGLAALLERLCHERRRQDDDGNVARPRDRKHVAIRLQPLHLRAIRIDRIKLAFIAACEHVHQRLAAERLRVARRADDSDRAWCEQARKIGAFPPGVAHGMVSFIFSDGRAN
jgi:hypothetical protein